MACLALQVILWGSAEDFILTRKARRPLDRESASHRRLKGRGWVGEGP